MLQRLGNVIYWATSGIALLFVFVAVFALIRGAVVTFAVFLVPAGLIWLVGKAARHVLA
jgi:hypothetical protein